MSSLGGAEKVLLVKGRAGLGNRILSALSGMVYARLTGRRLIVDWSDATYSSDRSNVFQRLFECPQCSADEIPRMGSVHPSIWQGRLTESVAELQKAYPDLAPADFARKSTVDTSRIDHAEDVLVFWAYTDRVRYLRKHFKGQFAPLRRMSRDAILTRLLEQDLVPHRDIRHRVEEFWTEHLDGGVIGVHVRYSDRRARLEVILQELDTLVGDVRDARIFFATDNIDIKRLLEKRYRAAITAPHWYPPPGASAHQNKLTPDRLENGIEAMIDLYLLARCSALIVDTRSSLSRVAALLAAETAAPIIDVRPLAKLSPLARRFLRPVLIRVGLGELASDGVVGRDWSSADLPGRDSVATERP